MGIVIRTLCNSKVENDYFHMVNREYSKYKSLFKCLGFTEEAGKEMVRVFYRLDADGGRTVDFDEFAKFFDVDNTPFSKKCFMLMDTQKTGEINFAQFVVACWNYCTYDKNGLTGFSFKLYDTSGIGQIPIDEVFRLVDDVYDLDKGMKGFDYSGTVNVVKNSPEYVLKQAKRQIAKACGADKQMNILEFLMFCKTHPSLLKSAFGIQTRLQKAVVSVQFWQVMTTKRRKLEKINGVQGVNFLEYHEVMQWLGDTLPNIPLGQKKRSREEGHKKKEKKKKGTSPTSKPKGKYIVGGKKGEDERRPRRKGMERKNSIQKLKDWAKKVGPGSDQKGGGRKGPNGKRRPERGNSRKSAVR